MRFKRLLDVIQGQRHDFLNHLQVISGLHQLKKGDQLRDYLAQISLEQAKLSKTAKVKIPEVTACLLNVCHEAAQSQVELEMEVASNFTGCVVPGPVVAESIEICLSPFFRLMGSPDIGGRHLKIYLDENEGNYTCRVLFPEPPLGDPGMFDNELEAVGGLLGPAGGRVNMAVVNGGVEIFLLFPGNEK
ncbi:MAG: sensory histidine kinase DcuS [Firmicutes bacterium ADurb.Bin456]|nr:MAG: sensory histidine kinase DcuS [Firmicutes bacterium ADurb.Bin456]